MVCPRQLKRNSLQHCGLILLLVLPASPSPSNTCWMVEVLSVSVSVCPPYIFHHKTLACVSCSRNISRQFPLWLYNIYFEKFINTVPVDGFAILLQKYNEIWCYNSNTFEISQKHNRSLNDQAKDDPVG